MARALWAALTGRPASSNRIDASPARGGTLAFVGMGLVWVPPALGTTIEGYAWPPSVAQGDTVGLYVSTDAPTFDVEILRDGRTPVAHLYVEGVPGTEQAVPDSAWQGCDWTLSLSVAVQPDWPSGVYLARLVAPDGLVSWAVFTVREDEPGSTSPILFQTSINTYQAYNAWGGKSLYDANSTEGARAHVVSFQRPYEYSHGAGQYTVWEQPLVRWLEEEGYAVEYCTDLDTHRDPSLQSHYDLFLVGGHDEYWSKAMRDNIEGRIASGGDVAFLAGNVCWWQIRYSPGLDQVICYKDVALDPLFGVEDSLVTGRWHEPPLEVASDLIPPRSSCYDAWVIPRPKRYRRMNTAEDDGTTAVDEWRPHPGVPITGP